MKNAPLAACLVDADFKIRVVSAGARPVFQSIPNPIGRGLGEVLRILRPGDKNDDILKGFRRTLETGESSFGPDDWRADRIPLRDGRFGVICYFAGFSAEELARSEERFRAFVTASADVVYRMSADWSEMRFLRGRDFIADTEGPTRSWIDSYIHPDDRPSAWEKIQQAIRTKNGFELEYRVLQADGAVGWRFSRVIPMLDPQGEIVEWLGTARDITGRKEAEEAVARLTAHSEKQRRFYEAILSSTPDLVYVFDVEHRFTYANKALLTMWGKNADEAIGRTCLELGYEPWHAAMHDREIEQVIATKQPIRGEVPFSGTYGRRIYDYIFVPVIGPGGEVDAIAGTTRDVTERHMAEEELRQANQDLEQFAYAATHDLREPMRTVKLYSELLERRYGGSLEGQALEYLKFLQDGATRMDLLISDLLSYTYAGKEEATSHLTDARACLDIVLANLRAGIAESGAEIQVEPLPSVRIRDTQLLQVFQNLISNALKYRFLDRIPRINVSAQPFDCGWRFTVRDNGIGIEEQYKEQIFGLFKRLHHHDNYAGTGIGLALCKRIIERNNGVIWVDSKLGCGSEFHFTLPR